MLGSRCTRSVAKSWQNLGTNTFCQAVLEPVCTLHPPVSPDLLCLVLFSCFPFPSHLLTVQREPSLLCYLPGGGTASDLFSLMPFCLSSVPPFNFFLSSALSSLLVKRLNHLLTPFISSVLRNTSGHHLLFPSDYLFSYFPVISPSLCALNVPLTHGCLSWDLCANLWVPPPRLSSTCGKVSFFNASISSYLTHI